MQYMIYITINDATCFQFFRLSVILIDSPLSWLHQWHRGKRILVIIFARIIHSFFYSSLMGLLPDTSNCGLCMRRECRERFPRRRIQRKPRVSDPGMHYGTCVTHVPWCMSGSLYPQWWGKRSRHSRRMRIRNLTYLARGLCYDSKCIHVINLSVVRITAVCWDIHALDTNEATMNDTNNSEWNQLLK